MEGKRGGDGMDPTRRVVHRLIKVITRIMCRVEDAPLAEVPEQGPLIIVSNHVNFLEAPVLYSHLLPRRMFGFMKSEAWHSPGLRLMAWLWQAIPLERGEADMRAMREALKVLAAGDILVIAPEGTRSGHGRLLRAKAGFVVLALRTGAPVLPVLHYGGEVVWQNLRRLRRTDFHTVVGRAFYLDPGGVRVTAEVRQQMADEVMYQMAALLPPAYRGAYSDLVAATETYLRFPAGAPGNPI
jgi:1-acyl-sn-glycerol-3-phosphate acyltransferase